MVNNNGSRTKPYRTPYSLNNYCFIQPLLNLTNYSIKLLIFLLNYLYYVFQKFLN